GHVAAVAVDAVGAGALLVLGALAPVRQRAARAGRRVAAVDGAERVALRVVGAGRLEAARVVLAAERRAVESGGLHARALAVAQRRGREGVAGAARARARRVLRIQAAGALPVAGAVVAALGRGIVGRAERAAHVRRLLHRRHREAGAGLSGQLARE